MKRMETLGLLGLLRRGSIWSGRRRLIALPGNAVCESLPLCTRCPAAHALSRTLTHIDLARANILVDPIAPGIAILAGSYRAVLTPRTGRETRARGYFTGLAVHTPSGWQLRDAHWSPDVPRSP